MSSRHARRVILWCLGLLMAVTVVRSAFSGPIFDPVENQSICEKDWLVLIIYAEASFSEDELEFEMDGAPAGAELVNNGRCGE